MPRIDNPDGSVTVTDDKGNIITKDRFGKSNIGSLLQESETRRLEQKLNNQENTANVPPSSVPFTPQIEEAPPPPPFTTQDFTANHATKVDNSAAETANRPTSSNAIDGFQSSQPDLRIRLRARPNKEEEAYGPNDNISIMAPLYITDGLLFPYTPTINWSQQIDYASMQMVHTNQDFHYYTRTPSTKLTIVGPFTAQNAWEARYCLAVMHFLRSNTKMYFGQNDDRRGLPPPIFLLDGYGDYMFNSLPVIIMDYTIELNQNIDYFPIDLSQNFSTLLTSGAANFDITQAPKQNVAWVPINFNVTISCVIQNTPNRWRKEFSLEDFRNGKLLGSNKKGWF